MNSITSIADRLVILCNNRQFVEAYEELFHESAICIDPIAGQEPIIGLQVMIEREKNFLANIELHEIKVSEAIFSSNHFSVVINMHFTTSNGENRKVKEIAVYKVEDGKIASQQFFI